jgi:ankyrin repeat protein
MTPTPGPELSRLIDLDDAEQLKQMLDAGLSPNALIGMHPMANEGRLLESAAQKNARKVAALLIEAGVDVDEGRLRPLTVAVVVNSLEMARLLLDNGADPNVKRSDVSENHPGKMERGFTPLMYAMLPPRGVELVELLLARGANPNAVTNKGTSALSRAVNHGNAPAAKALLQAGCKPDGSLLLRPIFRGDLDVVRAFIAASVDLNVKGIWSQLKSKDHWEDGPVGCTPLDAAVSERANRVESLRNLLPCLPAERARSEARFKSQADLYLTMVRELIRGGADVNKIVGYVPPLYWASNCGDLDTVKLLLEAGADPNLLGTLPGNTPLHTACLGGFVEIVECLLKAGADVTVTNEKKRTPLEELRRLKKSRELVLWEQVIQNGTKLDAGMMEALYEAWNKNRARLIELLESIPGSGRTR